MIVLAAHACGGFLVVASATPSGCRHQETATNRLAGPTATEIASSQPDKGGQPADTVAQHSFDPHEWR